MDDEATEAETLFLCGLKKNEDDKYWRKENLTFAVSDMGELPTLEENLKYFNPPTAADNRKVSTSTEIYYYQLLVRLLGGFIYIDPDYKNGRRVIFSIAI